MLLYTVKLSYRATKILQIKNIFYSIIIIQFLFDKSTGQLHPKKKPVMINIQKNELTRKNRKKAILYSTMNANNLIKKKRLNIRRIKV